MANPVLNLSNPYMKEILDLYAARPSAKKAIQRVVAYYDLLLARPDSEKESIEWERSILV